MLDAQQIQSDNVNWTTEIFSLFVHVPSMIQLGKWNSAPQDYSIGSDMGLYDNNNFNKSKMLLSKISSKPSTVSYMRILFSFLFWGCIHLLHQSYLLDCFIESYFDEVFFVILLSTLMYYKFCMFPSYCPFCSLKTYLLLLVTQWYFSSLLFNISTHIIDTLQWNSPALNYQQYVLKFTC